MEKKILSFEEAKLNRKVALDYEEDVDEDGKWVKVNYWGTEGYMQRRHLKTGWATIYDNGEVMAQ